MPLVTGASSSQSRHKVGVGKPLLRPGPKGMGATDCVGWRVIGVNGGLDSGSSKGMVSAYIVLDLGMAVAAHKHWSSPWRVGAHRYVGRHQPCECGVSRRMFGAAMSIHVLGPSIRVFTPFRCRNGVGRLYASHSPRSVRLGCIADPVGGALVLASILHSGGLTCDGALSSAMRLWPTSVWRAHRIWWWMILADD